MSTLPMITSLFGPLRSSDEVITENFRTRGIFLQAPVRTAKTVSGMTLTSVIALTSMIGENSTDAAISFLSTVADLLPTDAILARFTYRQLTVLPFPEKVYRALAESAQDLTPKGLVKQLSNLLASPATADQIAAFYALLAKQIIELAPSGNVVIENLTGDTLLDQIANNNQVAALAEMILPKLFNVATPVADSDLIPALQYFIGVSFESGFVTPNDLNVSNEGLQTLDIVHRLRDRVTFVTCDQMAIMTNLMSIDELSLVQRENAAIPPAFINTLETLLVRQVPPAENDAPMDALVFIASKPGMAGIMTSKLASTISVPALIVPDAAPAADTTTTDAEPATPTTTTDAEAPATPAAS